MRHGDILQKILKEKNMKVSELSRISGIPAQTLYGIIRRNNLNTDKKTLATISKALDVSFSIWELDENERILRHIMGNSTIDEGKDYLDKEIVSLALELSKRTYQDIAAVLNCLGISSYTGELLENIVNNHIAISQNDKYIINYILWNTELLSWSELQAVFEFRKLEKENKVLLEKIYDKITESDRAEKKRMDEWLKELNENK